VPRRPRCLLCQDQPLPPQEPLPHHFIIHDAPYMTRRTNQMRPRVYGIRNALPLQLRSEKIKITEQGVEELAPPAGVQSLPRWAQGPLSVPCRPGTPTYKLQVKTKCKACLHTSPRALQHQTLPRCQGGLRCFHVSRGTGPCLPAREGSSAAMYTAAPGPASLPGGLWHYHASYGFGPCLPARRAPTLSHVLWFPMDLEPQA
jgi:hypothetical protein